MIINLSCALLIAGSMSACVADGGPKQGQSNDRTGLPITISATETNPVNPNLHGFNTANMFMFYEPQSTATELIQQVNPQVLRFPGGTTANFYHFGGKGYGYRQEDAALVQGSNAFENISKSYTAEQKLLSQGELTQNYAVPFADLALEVQANVVLVANLFSGSDEEVLDMVQYFVNRGVHVVGIELGNEYYFKAYDSVFPTVEAYIERAEKLAQKLKQAHPDIPLAAVAATSAELRETGARKAESLVEWNQKLGQERFYDAIITHMYSKPKKCMNLAQAEKFDCSLSANTVFAYKKMPDAVEYYKQFYGNKPVWITEWNMQGVFEYAGNTFLQMAYYADFAFSMVQQQRIDLACYHNLLSGGSGFNMIGVRNKSEQTAQSGKFLRRTAYYTAELLKPIFTGSVTQLRNPLEPSVEIARDVTIRAYKLANQRLVLYFVNKSADPISLAQLEFDAALPDYDQAAVSYVIAEDLTSGMGANPVQNGDNLRFHEENLTDIHPIQVPAYSIVRIILSK